MAFGVSSSSGGSRFGVTSGQNASAWTPAGSNRKASGSGGGLMGAIDRELHPDNPHGIGGFIQSLAGDIGSAAIGIPVGLFQAGKGIVSDIGNIGQSFSRGDMSAFSEDHDGISDIFKAIGLDYKDTYGNGGEHFKEKFYSHPLGPILDVLTVLTAGGGAVAKGAQVSGKAGTLGTAGSKVLALEKATVPEGMTAREFVAKEGARAGRKGYVDAEGNAMIPRRRVVRTSAAKRDKLTRAEAEAQGQAYIRTSHQNPVQRPREAVVDYLSELFPNAKFIGADRRAGRQVTQRIQRESKFDAKISGADDFEGMLTNPIAKLGGIREATKDPLIQHQAQNLARGVKAEERAAQLERDLNSLPSLTAKVGDLEAEAKLAATVLKKVAARHRLKGDEEAATHYDHMANELMGHEDDVAARARKAGRSTEPSDKRRATAEMAGKIARSIRDNGIDRTIEDITGRLYMAKNAKWIEPKMRAELEHQKVLQNPDALTDKQHGIVNKLLAGYHSVGEANTRQLKRGGVEPRKDIAYQAQRTVGVPEDELRPAIKLPDRVENRVTGGGGGGSARLRNAPKPSQARKSAGISYKTAQHMADPRAIVRSYRDGQRWLTSKKSWEAMLQSAIKLDGHEPVPKGFVIVDGSKVNSYAARVRQFLDEDAPVVFGDSPQLEQMQNLLVDGFHEKFGGTDRVAVPKAIHDRLMGEIEQGNKALTAWIDHPTALWRTLTLTIRPAFYTNNLLGQSMLLYATHGAYKTIRNGIELARDAELRNQIASHSGGITSAGQLKFMSAETNRLLEGKSFAFQQARLAGRAAIDANDLAGRLGAAITDDPLRRLSMYTELRPFAKDLAEEKGISLTDAMQELLDDPKVMEHVEEKVLGDLVDFSNLTHGERVIVRRVAPFYSWLKGSSKRAAQMVVHEPGKANLGLKLGQYGSDSVVQELGGEDVPDFIKGSIVASGLGEKLIPGKPGKDGKQTLVTAGWQPFSTPADILGMFTSLGKPGMPVGASNPISSLNPVLQIPLEGFSNRDSFSGQQLGQPGDSLGRKMLGSAALSTPLASAFYSAHQKRSNPEYNSNALYRASITNEVLKFLGVPARDLNVAAAHKIGSYQPINLEAKMPAPGEVSWVRGPDGHMYALEDRGDPDTWGGNNWSPAQ